MKKNTLTITINLEDLEEYEKFKRYTLLNGLKFTEEYSIFGLKVHFNYQHASHFKRFKELYEIHVSSERLIKDYKSGKYDHLLK